MIEIDGPKMAFFGNEECRIIYRTLGIMAKNPVYPVKTMMATIERVKQLAKPSAVLFWRRRPELVEEKDEHNEPTGMFKVTCRLAVSPDLSKEEWDALLYIKSEGEICKELIE